MNIVIPMAGLGSRFSQCGFTLPKPLINVIDKPMYRYAVDCLPLDLATKLIFILVESDFLNLLIADIKKHYSPLVECEIIVLKETTRGQAETVLKAASYLKKDEATLIHNCDTYFEADFDWSTLAQPDIDGAVIVFDSSETRWSYVQIDDNNKVLHMKEKSVISSHASTGTYFFKNTLSLIHLLETLVEQDLRENNEYYLSTVYQLMLQAKKHIVSLKTKTMLCFGTPQDLVNSLNTLLKRAYL